MYYAACAGRDRYARPHTTTWKRWMDMATWLKDAVPHIWAAALGVVLAIVLGFGLWQVVDSSSAGKAAPTPEQRTAQP